jgi:hypothetical protein
MATTTNYSWSTPDDTALVKDGAAAIRSLGTSVDTTTKALNPSTTLGDIEYRSSTANTNTRLGIGSTGQVLTVAGGVPTWAASAGGGKVLQVVAATYSTETQSTTNTYVDTGLTATITPSSATSKVLVIMTQNGVAKNGDTAVNLRLVRGATTLAQIGVLLLSTSTSLYQEGNGNIAYLDSPATTSATTYKTTFNSGSNISFARVQNNSSVSSIILMEIGA